MKHPSLLADNINFSFSKFGILTRAMPFSLVKLSPTSFTIAPLTGSPPEVTVASIPTPGRALSRASIFSFFGIEIDIASTKFFFIDLGVATTKSGSESTTPLFSSEFSDVSVVRDPSLSLVDDVPLLPLLPLLFFRRSRIHSYCCYRISVNGCCTSY